MDLRGFVRAALLMAAVWAVGAAVADVPTWKSGATTVTLSPDGTRRVSGNGAMDDYDYDPSKYAPWRVGWCGDNGPCYGYDELPIARVVIEDGVTSIGKNAFAAIRGLTSAAIPNSVASIGESAFIGCYGLTSVTIPGSAVSIGRAAFHDCRNLTSVTIENGVKSIGEDAFSHCTGLTSVTIPGSIDEIAEAANGVWLALSGTLTALILSAAVFVIIRRLRKSSRKETA